MGTPRIIPVCGADGYYVDVVNQVAYAIKYGKLHELHQRTKYRSVTLTIGGKTVGSTIYRMMYCAINGIDIAKIPTELCISISKDGKLEVLDRSMVVAKANKARQNARPKIETLTKNLEMLNAYYKGDSKPLLEYLHKLENIFVNRFIYERGLCMERAQMCCAQAVNLLLDELRDGFPPSNIRTRLRALAMQQNAIVRKTRSIDNSVISMDKMTCLADLNQLQFE